MSIIIIKDRQYVNQNLKINYLFFQVILIQILMQINFKIKIQMDFQ